MINALPSRRDEAWKYSDLRAVLTDAPAELRLPAPAAPGESVIARLARGMARTSGRLDINQRGAVTEVQCGALGEVRVAAGAAGVLIERMEGEEAVNVASTDISIAEGGSLLRVLVQAAARPGPVMLNEARVTLAAHARFRQIICAEGARLARLETRVSIEGEGAEVELAGLYLLGADRHADLTSLVTHAAPRAKTSQVVRGVARRGGRGVFQGKIVVAPGAVGTNARQHHKALMLEDGAEIDAKPELEIYADDVQCAHGNAIGALDEDQLFYVRTRGAPEARARAMLVEAFAHEALPEGLPDDVYMMLLGRIDAWLNA